MTQSRRVRALLLLLLLALGAQAGRLLYRWYVYGEERADLAALREQVVDSGVEVLRTQARADTLRREVERADSALEARRQRLARYGSYAENGGLPSHLYTAYRAELDEYNARVRERNRTADLWTETMKRNEAAVQRYNQLADSIRAVAYRIGDPYYPIPLPVEAAAERGIIPRP